MAGRGSEWSRWDLHVHTPASIRQNYGPDNGATWERFVSELEALPSDFSVIGVNDYLFLDGYRKLCGYKAGGRLSNIQLLLPVIELRLSHFGGTKSTWSRVNLHVIFDPTLTAEQIESYFLTALRRSYKLSPEAQLANVSWESFPTYETLRELGERIIASAPEDKRHEFGPPLMEGFNNLNVTLDQVIDALRDGRLKGRHLLAIGKAEWADIKWADGTIAEKKNVINQASFVFTAAESPAAALRSRDALSRENVLSKLLDCSDAHSFGDSKEKDRLGNCCTWIKAEPTFRGLKYAAIEYDSRVHLGERPSIFSRMAANPNSFIDELEIRPRATCPADKRWLEVHVSMNPGLCCIIGNKGSGKSALTDAIGLAGNAHSEQEFSFLSSQRFRRKPENLAQHFAARIFWKSGRESTRNLDEPTNLSSSEEVRYLPQSYLEKLCNEMPGGEESLFEKELKRIIFLNLAPAERAGRSGLDDLVAESKEQFDIQITAIRSALKELNLRILDAEGLEVPAYRDSIEARITAREEQLRSHDATRPTAKPAPESDPSVVAANAALLMRITERETALKGLLERKATLEAAKARIGGELTKLRTALIRISEFRKLVERFESQLLTDLAGLLGEETIREIITLKTNDAKVRELLSKRELELSQVTTFLDDETESGLAQKLRQANEELEALRNQLSAPQRAYAKHIEEVAAWEKARQQIIGDTETADSLEWLRALRRKAEGASEVLRPLYEQRRALVGKLVDVTEDFRERLEVLYDAASNKVKKSEANGKSVPIEFYVRTLESGFVDRLLEFIHLGVRSAFQGTEHGHAVLRGMISNVDFSSRTSVVTFVEEVLARLRTLEDAGAGERRIDVQSILKSSFTAAEVYDYVSGLEYLRPSFRLIFEGRDLAILSPGQRGMVLLLFYLLVDAEEIPLVVDQPEENLDNQTVAMYLVNAFALARARRQIVVVTHNSNLAVVCDADQVIRSHRPQPDGPFQYDVGSLEGAEICKQVIEILEGTEKAFARRSLKYSQ